MQKCGSCNLVHAILCRAHELPVLMRPFGCTRVAMRLFGCTRIANEPVNEWYLLVGTRWIAESQRVTRWNMPTAVVWICIIPIVPLNSPGYRIGCPILRMCNYP